MTEGRRRKSGQSAGILLSLGFSWPMDSVGAIMSGQ